MKIALIIPTYNAGKLWSEWLKRLPIFPAAKVVPDIILVIDSSSQDETVDLAKNAGLDVVIISPSEFNHGGTRNRGSNIVGNVDLLVFMTQDALFADPNALEKLIECFSDPEVAAAYGRQLPHEDATPLACHARLFNYGEDSFVRTIKDIPKYGIKTAFMSNSFAAYRANVFHDLGGFPESTILAEDMYLTAKMLLKGYKVAYCSDAKVYHSHNYSAWDEFQRYFDIGVFHASQPWIREQFGNAEGEGLRYIKSELIYLSKHSLRWIPSSIISIFAKYLGYKLGLKWRCFPLTWCRYMSMHKRYWD